MTAKNIQIALFAVLSTTVMIASSIAINAEAQTEKLTRFIEDDEFKATVEQIHMMRSEQSRLNDQITIEGVENSAKILESDSKIKKLMPILDKHQEQTFAKYYIEPARRQYLESVETELRADVYNALIGNVGYFGVNLNEKDQIIEIVLSDPSEVSKIEAFIQTQPSDVKYNIIVEQYHDSACANTTDDCNPSWWY